MNAKQRNTLIALTCVGLFVAGNVALFVTGRFPARQAGLPDWSTTVGLIVAAAMTFAMYSFLYEDNPFFRAAENLFVGVGLGVTFYISWYQFFRPDIVDRLIVPLFEPTAATPTGDLVLVVPILLGVMMLLRISPCYGWVSRYPIAFMIGYGAGFSIQPTFHSLVLKQVEKTMVPVHMHWIAWSVCGAGALGLVAGAYYAAKGGRLGTVLKALGAAGLLSYVVLRNTPSVLADPTAAQAFRGMDSLIIMVGVVGVLCYFFFSAEHKGALGGAARVGIIFLMIAFGASFGYTVMARESLVIGRIQFLLGDWLQLM